MGDLRLKRWIVATVLGVLYALGSFLIGAAAWIEDQKTTQPVGLWEAWALAAFVFLPLPVGVYGLVELIWWNERRPRRTASNDVAPVRARVES